MALIAASSVVARADDAEKRAREVSASWAIQPLEPIPAPRLIQPHQFVFKQRLVPSGYALLDADATDAQTGRTILPAGSLLFRVVANTGIVECAIDNNRKTGIDAIFTGDTRICLRDRDASGAFGEYVRYFGDVKGLPSVNGRLPEKLHSLRLPVTYKAQGPLSGPDDLFIGIRYEGKAPLTGYPRFVLVAGRADSFFQLEQGWIRGADATGKKTGSVALGGSELEVTGLDGGDATIAIKSPLTGAAFGIAQYRNIGFY